MKLNWNKYYELSSEELQNIDKDTYIKELNYLIEGFENQIKIKFKKTETINEYMELLNDIKEKIKKIENIKNFELTQDKVNFINSLIELRKKLYMLSLSKKVELFMKYININNVPNQQSKIKFSDIDLNVTDDTLVGKWYMRQLYGNLNVFKSEIEVYKDIYQNAYKIIEKRIQTLPKNKKITKAYRKKVEIFMNFIEEDKISLPIKDYKQTFNEVNPKVGIESIIKDWVHNTVNNEKENFLSVCCENQLKYPKAYQIIINYLTKETKDNKLDNETRTKLFLSYVENNAIPVSKDKLTFIDIDSNCQDSINVADWLSRQISTNLNDLKIYLEKYKEIYPNGYIKTKDKISKLLYKEKRTTDLTNLEKEEIFMKYINENEIPTSKNTIKFKDIAPNSHCEYDIYNWSLVNIFTNNRNIMELICKYEHIYPNACKRLEKRIDELKEYREIAPIRAPYRLKVRVFVKYIEENKIPSDWCRKRFCDIEPNINDTTLVGNWFRDQLSRNLNKFYVEVSKYKDIYPNAYLKIANRINYSDAMIKKERKLLIGVLNQIKQELNSNKNEKKYNISR